MVKFKDDEFLGKTVKSSRIYCSIGVEPIKSLEQLRYAGGGNKFSSLCGFMFDSANEGTEFPRFMISFVCKLRSKIYRQQKTNPSQWFIFRRINHNRVDVLDKKALAVNYGFDIDKFFDSDLFKACLPKFEKFLKKGLADAKVFAQSAQGEKNKNEVERYIRAIDEAIPLMLNSKVLNDKYYQLNDLTALDKAVSAGVSDEVKKKALDAKIAAIQKGNKRFMDKVSANQRDVDLRQSEESEENVDEADLSKYKCKVEKVKEKGKDAWKISEVESGLWVATFHDEKAANTFAKEYPALHAKYIDDTAKIESDGDNKTSAEKTDECDVKEKELDKDIEESLKEIYK